MIKKLAVLLSVFCLALTTAGATAQEAYPTHPILLTHGNTPGSNSDLMARIIADPLAARLGQPVIVESRPGAGQTIAFGRVASGTPDGYTLIMMHSGHPIAEDIFPAFKALGAQADALYVVQDALTVANYTRIITLALGARLPTIFGARNFVQAGALMSYGANYPTLFRRAAELVDKVLRGTKPADIPVEQPTKFELVINLTTAKALGLTIPESFLARADEVIE